MPPATQDLAIIGGGGFAREVLDIVEACNQDRARYNFLGFIVDAEFAAPGTAVNDSIVVGGFDWLAQNSSRVEFTCAVGSPSLRRTLVEKASRIGGRFCTLVHPTVIRTRWVELGCGVVVAAGTVLSNQVRIEDHAQVNLHCTIGHDATLRRFSTLAPGVHISGNVVVGEGAYLGTGAAVIEKKSIGAWATVGAGGVVISDIEPHTTAVGVPARAIKRNCTT